MGRVEVLQAKATQLEFTRTGVIDGSKCANSKSILYLLGNSLQVHRNVVCASTRQAVIEHMLTQQNIVHESSSWTARGFNGGQEASKLTCTQRLTGNCTQ
jgi:hypothetical protein